MPHVDADHHPDLFWAIRGGGGNFGVATRVQLRLHDVASVTGGLLFLPATAEAIEAFIGAAEATRGALDDRERDAGPPIPFMPEEAHGKLVILAMVTYAGDVGAGERAIAPFRRSRPPIADMVRPMTYPEMYMPEEEGYHPIAAVRSRFIDGFDSSEASTIVEHLEASTRRCAWRSSACSAAPWRACRTTPPPSRIATGRSW